MASATPHDAPNAQRPLLSCGELQTVRVLHLTRLRLLGWLAVMLLTVHAGALGGSAQTPPPPPPGVAASASGPEIYVTDFNNNRIVRMDDMTGAGWVALGSLGPGANQLHEPTGIAVDPSGRIVVAD